MDDRFLLTRDGEIIALCRLSRRGFPVRWSVITEDGTWQGTAPTRLVAKAAIDRRVHHWSRAQTLRAYAIGLGKSLARGAGEWHAANKRVFALTDGDS